MRQTPICGVLGQCETLQSSELGQGKSFSTPVLELYSSRGGQCFLVLDLICL